jgi:hypothetical protein
MSLVLGANGFRSVRQGPQRQIGFLFFHQGWTDIINCLPLINVYAERYDRLFVLLREDIRPMVMMYCQPLRNVIPIFKPKRQLDTVPWFEIVDLQELGVNRLELIGHFDGMRYQADPYCGAYVRLNKQDPSYTFERLFYESYGLPYSVRVDKFSLQRDLAAEERAYTTLVRHPKYICVHTNPDVGGVEPNASDDTAIVELDKSSYVFWDMVKVLQNASEIHVIDSVWAAVCYLLDARYGLLSHVPITVYCHRNLHKMFTQPKRLPNWTIRGRRTAVLLCGQARFFKEGYTSIKKHVLDVYDPDVFIHTWSSPNATFESSPWTNLTTNITDTDLQEYIALYNPVAHKIDSVLDPAEIPLRESYERTSAPQTRVNYYSYLYSLRECARLLPRDYDNVIVLRSDMDIRAFPKKMTPDKIHIWDRLSPRTDVLETMGCIVPGKFLTTFVSGIDKLDEYYDKGYAFNFEEMTHAHMEESGLYSHVLRVPTSQMQWGFFRGPSRVEMMG